jgi:hypothetical protein
MGIPYMLTGSMAMSYYAQPRMTRDIDIVVALAASDIDTVVRLFEPDQAITSREKPSAIQSRTRASST